MSNLPIPVALCIITRDNKILLNKRIKNDYIGYWSLVGGKVDKDEHVSEAAIREVFEETGMKTEFKKHLGFVSEHLIENNQIDKHLLLHVVEMDAKDQEVQQKEAGEMKWFNINEINNIKDQTIPSDFLMIKKIFLEKEKNYYNSIIEKKGDNHTLIKFE